MTTLATAPASTTADPGSEAEIGLLSRDEVAGALRRALGNGVSDAQIEMAIAALQAAGTAKWEQLPPEINPDMGYHFRFLSCSETCWLGREVLLDGATFRVFKLRA